MDLRELHEKLYRKKDNLKNRELSEDRFDPEEKHSSGSFVRSKGLQYKDVVDPNRESFFERNKLLGIIILSVAGFIVFIIFAFFIVRYMQDAYAEERVILKVEGAEAVDSGGITEYKITVYNNNRTKLTDVVLNLNYSSELEPQELQGWENNGQNRKKINIGTIGTRESKEYVVPFLVFGSTDTRIYLDATMDYRPKNISSFFEKTAQGSSLIKASLLQVEMFPSKNVANGEKMKIDLIVSNKSKESVKNVELEVIYPEQFSYQDATFPPTEEKNKWTIDSLDAFQQKTITVLGTLSGQVGSAMPFSAIVGKYVEAENKFIKYSETRDVSNIVANRVEITQIAKFASTELSDGDAVSSGQGIHFDIRFKNTSNDLMRDLILKAKISGKLINEDQVNPLGGYYDSEKKEIIWKASSFPALKLLEPGSDGVASFDLQLKEKFPVDSEADKNFTIETQTSIESLDVNSPISENKEIYSNKLVLKVNSRFIFDLAGKYKDPEFPTEGPLPVEANKETTFTPRLTIQNTSNDLEDVVFSASFPTGIVWKNSYLPKSANVQFNERSNELIVNIGKIKAGTGFVLPIEAFVFKVGVKPSEAQMAQTGGASSLVIMNNIKITAKDSFTGTLIENPIRDLKFFDVAGS